MQVERDSSASNATSGFLTTNAASVACRPARPGPCPRPSGTRTGRVIALRADPDDGDKEWVGFQLQANATSGTFSIIGRPRGRPLGLGPVWSGHAEHAGWRRACRSRGRWRCWGWGCLGSGRVAGGAEPHSRTPTESPHMAHDMLVVHLVVNELLQVAEVLRQLPGFRERRRDELDQCLGAVRGDVLVGQRRPRGPGSPGLRNQAPGRDPEGLLLDALEAALERADALTGGCRFRLLISAKLSKRRPTQDCTVHNSSGPGGALRQIGRCRPSLSSGHGHSDEFDHLINKRGRLCHWHDPCAPLPRVIHDTSQQESARSPHMRRYAQDNHFGCT